MRYGIATTTYDQFTLGSAHWYGRAWRLDEGENLTEHELSTVLSSEAADRLNFLEPGAPNPYNAGDSTIRFTSIGLLLQNGLDLLAATYGHDGDVEHGEPQRLNNDLVDRAALVHSLTRFDG